MGRRQVPTSTAQRVKLVREWERREEQAGGGHVDMTALARDFGISRQTAYVWLNKYLEADRDPAALEQQSRRPHGNSRAVPPKVEELIVAVRRDHPSFGPHALRDWIAEHRPEVRLPSPTTISKILTRHLLTAPPRQKLRRGRPLEVQIPFPRAKQPNELWWSVFSPLRTLGDGTRFSTYTLFDAYSRCLLACYAIPPQATYSPRLLVEQAFREHGLPKRMRSHGERPFCVPDSPATLAEVSLWMLRLDLALEVVPPDWAQPDGPPIDESPVAADLATEQTALAAWRHAYNHERPHPALNGYTPWTAYRRSPRKYPRSLLRPDGILEWTATADKQGVVKLKGTRFVVGPEYAYQTIAVWPQPGPYTVHFGSNQIGEIDYRRGETVLRPVKRPRGPVWLRLGGTDGWEPLDWSETRDELY
jgi:putative transposase